MLATAAAASAAWQANFASQSIAAEASQPSGPNDKLSVCCVGVGGRGTAHLVSYLGRKDCEITWIVDTDESTGKKRAAMIADSQGREPEVTADMREAFDDKQLDVVSIATPNHWHALAAIWAMQAGKDVYVEKPVSHNVSEGRRLVEAARKYNKVCQTGTQCRSNKGTRDGIQFVHDGGIGEVKLARGLCYKQRGSIGPKGEYPIPTGINYDLWLGPAPQAKLTRKRFHYDWHWQWPYGNGDLGNQGIHQMDVARWGLNVNQLANRAWSFGGRIGYEDAGDTANTQVCFYEFDDGKSLVFEVRGLKSKPYLGAEVGNIFHGSDGYVVMPDYDCAIVFDSQGKPVPGKEFHGGGDHFDNFFRAVRSRKTSDLNADILEGHLSSALCHLGNISYLQSTENVSIADLNRVTDKAHADAFAFDLIERMRSHIADNELDANSTTFKIGAALEFDPKTEKFVNNSAADALLTREYRAPFVLPV